MASDWTSKPMIIARTPLLPCSWFTEWATHGRDIAGLRQRLRELVETAHVRDALFVASPALVDSLDEWLRAPDTKRGQKTEHSLVRYVSRMAARPTPFGLFSGVAPVHVGDRTTLRVGARDETQRRTRLDNDYLFALCEALGRDGALRRELRYRPNSSLYGAAGQYRYAEAHLDARTRSYHLVAVERSEYLERTLDRARAGQTVDELARSLVDDDDEITLEEALEFVDELIDSQLLVSELVPAVTGAEPIDGVLAVLAETEAASAATATLREAREAIAALDRDGLGAAPTAYRAIATRLEPLPAPVDLARLFQVDSIAPLVDCSVGPRVLAEVERGIDVLHSITSPPTESALTRFRDAFLRRYEARQVPLVEALDEETGIGFASTASLRTDASPLLAGLPFPQAPAQPTGPAGGREAFLLTRVVELARAGERHLELDRAALAALAPRGPRCRLPDALSTMVVLAAASNEDLDRGNFELLIESAYGPSGARLAGRFCHALESIDELVREHLRAEESLRTDAVFAEIAHLPEGRIGNVLCRPVLRDYEIPFLGRSEAPRDRQLPLEDLLLSIENERIVLWSRSLQREVVPRLTTAHNYTARSLGIYQFLCSLQEQDGDGVGWDWGPLLSAPFLPRVTCGRLVFARARWLLRRSDIEPLAEATKGVKRANTPAAIGDMRARAFDAVQALRERRGIPRFAVLADADNELLVDFDNPLSVDSLVHLLRSRGSATLLEQFPANDQLFLDGAEGRHTHELVVSLVRAPATVADTPSVQRPVHTAPQRRCFAPGGEWLYAKAYCGPAVADEVLAAAVGPLVRAALQAGQADAWHFVRYADPEPHLRLRLHGEPAALSEQVLPALHRALEPFVASEQVWRVQLDTYQRETERYGGPVAIELAEQLFYSDSQAVLEIVELLEGDEGHDARWRLAVRGVDMLLDDFGFDLEAKCLLAQRSRDSFDAEFHADTPLRKALGVRYRAERDALTTLLARDAAADAASELEPGFAALQRRSARNARIIEQLVAAHARRELTTDLRETVWSYLHMHCNRILRSAQRAHELVIYDLLRRHYEAQRARG